MSSLRVSDLIEMAQRDYEASGCACAQTFPYQALPLERLLGNTDVSELTWETVEGYKLARIREGAARGTVNRELDGLSKGLSLAVLAGYIHLDSVPPMKRFRLRNARQGFVYPEEFRRIRVYLPPVVADIATFAYWSGWRKGEVLRLRWDLVQENWVRIRDKNGDSKPAPLVGELKETMARRRAARFPGCSLVFHRKGKPILSFRKSWNNAVEKAKIGRHIVFHDLRRSFINNGRQAGVDRKTLMELSGHRTHEVFDRYNIVSEDDLREATRRIMGLDD